MSIKGKEFGRGAELNQKTSPDKSLGDRSKKDEGDLKERGLKAILEALNDVDSRVRMEALKTGLNTLSEEGKLKVILTALKDSDLENCMKALEIGANILSGEERLEVLRTALKHYDSKICMKALEIGANILSGEERLEVLRTALKNKDSSIFDKAHQYLTLHYLEEISKGKGKN